MILVPYCPHVLMHAACIHVHPMHNCTFAHPVISWFCMPLYAYNIHLVSNAFKWTWTDYREANKEHICERVGKWAKSVIVIRPCKQVQRVHIILLSLWKKQSTGEWICTDLMYPIYQQGMVCHPMPYAQHNSQRPNVKYGEIFSMKSQYISAHMTTTVC